MNSLSFNHTQLSNFFKVSNPEGKVAIIGHSYFFKLWTGKWYDQDLVYKKQPKEHIWLNN